MKVLHIINSLKKGGAEGNLYRLCISHKKKYKKKINIVVITLIDNGFYEKKLRQNGIKVISLGINNIKILNFFKIIIKFRKVINKISPDLVQSWMYHSNFLSLFINQKKKYKIFWNIRHSELNFKISKKKTIFISMICGLLSYFIPHKIIYCSKKSINFHEKKHFYAKNKSVLIHNGYSDKTYFPSKKIRINFRKKNNIKSSHLALGFAGRYSKQKNIVSLLSGFSKIVKYYDNIYLFMAGKKMDIYNKELIQLTQKFDIQEKVILLGEQSNLLNFYNGIDLLILVSHSESFPNVVAESMLCSTPVLSTDAGCSKEIIEECGFIIKKNDDFAIYNKLKSIIKFLKNKNINEWALIKKNCRFKIQKKFSLNRMAFNYLENWIF